MDDDTKLHVQDSMISNNTGGFTYNENFFDVKNQSICMSAGVIRGTWDCHMNFTNTWAVLNNAPIRDSSSFGFFDGHVSLTLRNSIIGSPKNSSECPLSFTINDYVSIDSISKKYICNASHCASFCV